MLIVDLFLVLLLLVIVEYLRMIGRGCTPSRSLTAAMLVMITSRRIKTPCWLNRPARYFECCIVICIYGYSFSELLLLCG